MKNQRILRNIFFSVGVLFALVRPLAAGTPHPNFITFDVPGAVNGTEPTSINSAGTIAGLYFDASFDTHGFLRAAHGNIATIDFPGAIFTAPFGINTAGAIVGDYTDASFVGHGFLRARDGTFTTIDFPGASSTEALAINPAGAIAGDFCNATECYRGYLRAPDGTFTVIGPPGEFVETIPAGINPAGAITGTFYDGVNGSRLPAESPRHLHHLRSSGLHIYPGRQHQPGRGDHGILP